MDKDTRNRIQRATQAARSLLEHEYAEQLEGVFDIRLDGTIAAEPGEHLGEPQRVLRRKLVTAVEHQRTSGISKADAVAAYLREAAFTTLNRFVALKMLEARELVQECISRGDQSAGFKEFTGLAPALVQLPDHGYRVYIESLFDEIGREVRVLFDRRDPASLLWPRRQALLDLLAVLNTSELAHVWTEDETIGWVYQYFNSDEERRQMRAESAAPRNSRELAVRNQFFTPRYVVQFLTENTLGRIWYEMRRGDTRLRDLNYLVRRPNEVFLAERETPPGEVRAGNRDLTQQQLLHQPFHVPFRAKKDPRDIRVLDPACGSGHFLLYAFDLLITIYQEAWADEVSPESESTGRTLREDYPELDALQDAVPALILQHNLNGIDIDVRCAQIAALALWLRAQRAYQDLGIHRQTRLSIKKTNIVVAEAMPGEPDMRREFVASLEPKLGQIVECVFDRMRLAGEAGALLQIDRDIDRAIREAYGEHGDLFRTSDEDRWMRADGQLLDALQEYAERSGGGGSFRRRLFADDAAQGLGFINVCRARYDVLVMNPPFGVGTKALESFIEAEYSTSKRELACAFLQRAGMLLREDGLVGEIGTRTPLFIKTYAEWRSSVLDSGARLRALLDLGRGVLDATVESAAFVAGQATSEASVYFKALEGGMVLESVSDLLSRATSDFASLETFTQYASEFQQIPNCPIAYWVRPSLARTYSRFGQFEAEGRDASSGASTNDDFRFLRLWCEVPSNALGQSRADTNEGLGWIALAKGGEYAPYYRNLELVINWRADGAECKAFISDYRGKKGWGYHWAAALNGYPDYFRPGITWSRRTSTWISGRALPAGCIFGDKGPAAFMPQDSREELFASLGWMNSAAVSALLALSVGKEGSQGTAASSSYEVGVVERLPFPGTDALRTVAKLAEEAYHVRRDSALSDELSRYYLGPRAPNVPTGARVTRAHRLQRELDHAVAAAYGLDDKVNADLELGSRLEALDPDAPFEGVFRDDANEFMRNLQWVVGCVFGRWTRPADLGDLPQLPGPFEPIPVQPLVSGTSLCDWVLVGGVAVEDDGHPEDLVGRCLDAAPAVGIRPFECDLRSALRTEFWSSHISSYSRSRRKAPIYWQLSVPSTKYSIWLYYHDLTTDTFYRVLNDYVAPKLKHEARKLTSLVQEYGLNPSTGQRKELEAQDALVNELSSFRDEVVRIAPLWNPDLNDGVIINFAPLWRLVPQHRAWQKECKDTWVKLRNGNYDWAHLAMHLWAERVVPKCARDRSLAIAHGLEGVFWREDSDGKWQPRKVDQVEVDELVKARTSAAVKDALRNLLEAPAPMTGRASRKKALRAKGTRKRTASARPAATTNGATSPGRSSAAVNAELLVKVKAAIGSRGDGVSKADVIDTTGISAGEWNKVIKALLADGSVTQTGERRGARYHLAGGDA